MKIEKAIERMESYKRMHTDDYFNIAINALEKQIPIPPENKVSEKYPSLGRNHYCKCGVMFMDWENHPTNYCGNCGQRLREDE